MKDRKREREIKTSWGRSLREVSGQCSSLFRRGRRRRRCGGGGNTLAIKCESETETREISIRGGVMFWPQDNTRRCSLTPSHSTTLRFSRPPIGLTTTRGQQQGHARTGGSFHAMPPGPASKGECDEGGKRRVKLRDMRLKEMERRTHGLRVPSAS